MKYLRYLSLLMLGAMSMTVASCGSSSSDKGHPCKMHDDDEHPMYDEDRAEDMDDDDKDRAYHDARKDDDSSHRSRDRQSSSSSRGY